MEETVSNIAKVVEKSEPPKEVEVDYMADAPAARPYRDAITDEHRAALEEAGFEVK